MKPGKHTVDLKESELLDEVHRAEKEIDLYLKDQAREAELILEKAQAMAEAEQDRIAREAEGQFEETYRRSVDEGKAEAEKILVEGTRRAETERTQLAERRDYVVEKILELVLEKKP